MSRGTKLDLFIGADIKEGWTQTKETISAISNETLVPQKHFLFFKKEKRRGKSVTLVGEFFITDDEANSLLKSIKKQLGCGGSYKEGWMEFQGELKEKLKALLVQNDFRFKSGH